MITAIDTNILLDILIPNTEFLKSSGGALQESASAGSLLICDIVYAELCVHFAAQHEIDTFLKDYDIGVQSLSRDAHFLASRASRTYRRQGGKRTRILTDFLIAAHAETHATRLLTRDRGFYRELFPSLKLFDPAS